MLDRSPHFEAGGGVWSDLDALRACPTPIRRFHIVGAPRSGTSLLHELFRTCFEIGGACGHEMSIFDEPDANVWHSAAGPFVSKQPRDERFIRPLLLADPTLVCIALIRDPRAVITSVHSRFPGMYFTNLHTWLASGDAISLLQGHPRFRALRYEDLVADPDAVQHQLASRWPELTPRIAFSEFHHYAHASPGANAAMGGVRPIARDRISAWRDHLPRVKAEFAHCPCAFERLVQHRYERDDSWQIELEHVCADAGKCYANRKVHWLKRLDR